MTHAPLYTLRGIRRRFDGREVLTVDELAVESGKIYGLLGPNGAGKTTLMRLLSFLDTPDEGEILFRGLPVRPDQAAGLRAKVVWVPQSPVMFSGSLLYNVEYPMRLRGVDAAGRRARAEELLEIVGLSHLAGAPAPRLSGGEAQRGSIARALAAGAEVILFDEPTASVDHRSRAALITLISDLWRVRGLSLLVTTHDGALADELCQERIMLLDGKVVPQRALPGGVAAWPARLEKKDGAVRVLAPAQALPAAEALHAGAISGVQEIAGGIRLRLALASGGNLDLLLDDEQSLLLGRTLTLGLRLSIATD